MERIGVQIGEFVSCVSEEIGEHRKKYPSSFPVTDMTRERMLSEMSDIDMLALSCVASGNYAHWYYERSIGELMLYDAYMKLREQFKFQ